MRFQALDYDCPRCGVPAHKACRKLRKAPVTGYLRVPHAERRALSGEGVNATPLRRRKAAI